jgi:hypothetical protein
MTDSPERDPLRAQAFTSQRTEAGDTPPLRRWSVAKLLARSRFGTERSMSRQAHSAPRPQEGDR